MTRRVLCAGEVVVDLVLGVAALPRRGGDVVATSATALAGGATNVMTAVRRQGVPVTYAGLLGTGPMATLAGSALAAEGITVVLEPRPDRDTATVVALVEPGGERTFVTTLGAEADLTDADLARVEVRDDDVVHVSGYGLAYPSNGPALAGWVPGLPPGVTVVLDPGPLVAAVPAPVLAPVLERVDVLTCTVDEARWMLGDTAASTRGDTATGGAVALAAALRSRLGHGAVVVRAGERGAGLATGDQSVHVAAFAVDAVDTNGAGDTHTGLLLAALAVDGSDVDLAAAVRRANAAAAVSVTRHGPATAPTAREVDTFLADADADVDVKADGPATDPSKG